MFFWELALAYRENAKGDRLFAESRRANVAAVSRMDEISCWSLIVAEL
jgi:hypothetical protein